MEYEENGRTHTSIHKLYNPVAYEIRLRFASSTPVTTACFLHTGILQKLDQDQISANPHYCAQNLQFNIHLLASKNERIQQASLVPDYDDPERILIHNLYVMNSDKLFSKYLIDD